MEHRGGCHCGNIHVRLRLSKPPQENPLRACACSFCRGHNTRTVADPAAGQRAVVNVNCLDDRASFTQAPNTTDYDGETTETRLARRASNWMPALIRRS
jgi:hypothetical protein